MFGGQVLEILVPRIEKGPTGSLQGLSYLRSYFLSILRRQTAQISNQRKPSPGIFLIAPILSPGAPPPPPREPPLKMFADEREAQNIHFAASALCT